MARKRVGCSNRRRRISQPGEVISDKLEALKCLIPCNVGSGSNEVVKVEQLFQETADYIITLKTQAFVLQKLIEFYDHSGDGFKNEKQPPIVQEDH
ncbi:hypothetical protein V6N13_043546 [Hibiscus sabdariffa]|uniref:BHLH domain-containing protein n=1 Tax=Hibiscus sabdariffa TaxID=183260 RepID=A0ABR2RFT9_9ROSI